MKKFVLVFLIGCLSALSISAQELNRAKLDSLFNILESNDRYMGSFALSHKGRILYSKAIGYEDRALGKKATPDTKYRIGSITKMFTSALVFMAVEENKIGLDQTIDTYFPEVKNASAITIGHLLNHRSGIHNLTSVEDYLNWNTQPKTKEELLKKIADGPSVFDPGSKAEYSNSNYVLLTFILEDVFDRPYGDLIADKITVPLGLDDTYVGSKIYNARHEAFSYTYTSSWKKESETDMSIPLGAGALVSNPTDLNKFIEGLFSGQLIAQKSLDQMKTITDGYGMGIFQMPFYEKKGFGHNGGIDGFSSALGYIPEDQLAFALTSNGSRFSNNDILIAALSAFYGKPFDLPSFTSIELTSEELDPYLGSYASDQIPLKITITKEKNVLIAQATGQPSFPLEATEKHVFEFAMAGVRLEFDPDQNTMILKQGGGVYTYSKE
ncbi:serine hydrolase domain-containing protein [Pseudozobellia thermophila]|uniref:CubicO group peptidase, beta-lactamase class C family n=1 Tax=Pseudozobellia thermophila TaxID=192903 RepID=A0A1M6MYZ6_9FLAO|nr:serine hydrolase domain-containing protein [Pseudozobellia thermophila]SHJ88668.1 CubicO group peptidase, beta-lactamase class C family [Pseudozobellia thermophila]